MNRILLPIMAVVAALLLWPGRAPSLTGAGAAAQRQAPEFPTREPSLWINSGPLSISDLRGRVVLIDVWTYG